MKKTISISVELDENNIPKEIIWKADDQQGVNETVCKAFMLSLFDKDHLDTYRIDLWTNELQIAEMDRFTFQSLRGMVDSYYNATKNTELANEMQRFVQYFGEKTGIISANDQ